MTLSASDIAAGDVVTLSEDWTARERGVRFLVRWVGVQPNRAGGPETLTAHLSRIEHMPNSTYPTGRIGTWRFLPAEWCKLDTKATRLWRAAQEEEE